MPTKAAFLRSLINYFADAVNPESSSCQAVSETVDQNVMDPPLKKPTKTPCFFMPDPAF